MDERELRSYYTACKYIFTYYGLETQKSQLVQELSELIVAITKNDLENMLEEIADVQIMLDQFTINSPLWDRKIKKIQFEKVKRQLERIRQEKGI